MDKGGQRSSCDTVIHIGSHIRDKMIFGSNLGIVELQSQVESLREKVSKEI